MAGTTNKFRSAYADDVTYDVAEARRRGEATYRAAMAHKRQQPQAIGLREAIVAALRARFGSVPPGIEARIGRAELEELHAMLRRVRVAGSLADFSTK